MMRKEFIFKSTVMYGSNNSNNLKSHVQRIRRCLLIKHFKQQKLPSSNEKIAITGDLLINWRTKKIVANVSLNISLGNYVFACTCTHIIPNIYLVQGFIAIKLFDVIQQCEIYICRLKYLVCVYVLELFFIRKFS